jgi:YD repeat-containing protein
MIPRGFPGRRRNSRFDERRRLKRPHGFPITIAIAAAKNGNGTETTYAYDATGHVTGTTHARITPHVVIDDRTNTWDDAGNKTSRSDVRLPTGGTVHAYSYDSANRIVHSVETPPSGAAVTIDYAIDGLGNRTSVTGGSGAGTYTMSSTLPEPADFQVSQYTSTPFDAARTYDASGSLVGKTGATFQYDYRGQMVGSTCGTATSTYAYDAFGRRVREILAGGEERFLYDGRRVVEERDGSDVLKRAFVYGAGGNELLMTVGDVNGDGRLDRSFRHTDELGSVFAVTSQGGGVLERYDYEDGGKARFFTPAGASIPQSAIDNPILFQGLRYKFECDIALSQVGDCDPQIGRFTSAAGRNLWGDRFDKDPGNRTAYEPDWSTGFPFTGDTPPGKVDRREFVEYNGQQSNPFPFTVNRTVSGPGGILPTGPSSTGNIVEVCTGGPFTYYCCYYSETSGDWYGCIDIGWLETTTTE